MVMLIAAVAVVTWWLLPDLSEPGGWGRPYLPPGVGPVVEHLVGLLGLVVLARAVIVLIAAARHGGLDPAWRGVLFLLGLVAVGCGVFWRLITASVAGVNFGVVFFIMFGGPVAIMLVGSAIGLARSILNKDHHDHRLPPDTRSPHA